MECGFRALVKQVGRDDTDAGGIGMSTFGRYPTVTANDPQRTLTPRRVSVRPGQRFIEYGEGMRKFRRRDFFVASAALLAPMRVLGQAKSKPHTYRIALLDETS